MAVPGGLRAARCDPRDLFMGHPLAFVLAGPASLMLGYRAPGRGGCRRDRSKILRGKC